MQTDAVGTIEESLRVLVVEDEMTMIRMVATVLRGLGINSIRVAMDGVEALALFDEEENAFDMVICDWLMPNMDGLEFLKHVRASDQMIPFLMLTGNVAEEAIREAREAGVSAYITKPYTADDLQTKIKLLATR